MKTLSKNQNNYWDDMKALPQAAVVEGRNAAAWFDYIMKNDPDRMGWLIARSGGLGGSEAGTILAWHTGEIKSRKSVLSLARDKLFMRMPERPTADMLRGTVLENHIREVFENRLTGDSRVWKRRQDLEHKIDNSTPDAYPWMRASVDGVYEIDGHVVIVDFKAPSEASLKNQLRTEGNDEYKAQLNHYAIIAESADISVKGLWLVMYDYNRVATDGVQIIEVAIDLKMQQQLVEACEDLWTNYIMKGIIPDLTSKEEAVIIGEIPTYVLDATAKAAKAKIMEESCTRIYEENRVIAKDWIESQGQLGDLPLYIGALEENGLGAMRATAKPIIDTELAITRLYDLGKDELEIDELRKPGNYKDTALLARKYDELREKTKSLLMDIIEGKTPDPKTLAALAKCVDKPPSRDESTFNAIAVEIALVACGENPYEYKREVISLNLDRRAREDVSLVIEDADKKVNDFIKNQKIFKADDINDFAGDAPISSF